MAMNPNVRIPLVLLGVTYDIYLRASIFMFQSPDYEFYPKEDQYFGTIDVNTSLDQIIYIGERALFREMKHRENKGHSLVGLPQIDLQKFNDYQKQYGEYWYLLNWEVAQMFKSHEDALNTPKQDGRHWHRTELEKLEAELIRRGF